MSDWDDFLASSSDEGVQPVDGSAGLDDAIAEWAEATDALEAELVDAAYADFDGLMAPTSSDETADAIVASMQADADAYVEETNAEIQASTEEFVTDLFSDNDTSY